MPENQAVLFGGLNLGVLRILLFQGRAESPMERLAQGKRSGTLGRVIVSKTIYALKGQKRGYCAFVSHTQCDVLIGLSVRCFFKLFSKCHVFTLLPFQGVDIIFLFHIPRVPLRLPWARRSIGLSARLGYRPPRVSLALGKGGVATPPLLRTPESAWLRWRSWPDTSDGAGGEEQEIPMQGLAGFAWGFLFLRLRDGGVIYFLLSLSSAVSSAGIQLLQSQPPRFTLLPTRSVYPLSLTRREVQSIPSLLISKVVREGAIYVFILVVLFG